ncbi:MAG: hypothetical protein HRT88_00535 [Lentisphaeraceae bacterium]|nr:hypothetical protein [Lentisphaeraceae bacterium]
MIKNKDYLNRVYEVFNASPMPLNGHEVLDAIDPGFLELRGYFSGIHWQEISLQSVVKAGSDALHQFTEKGYIYYFPSFLINHIKTMDQIDSDILVILSMECTSAVNYKHTKKRLHLFSVEQLALLAEVFYHSNADYCADDVLDSIDLIEKIIKQDFRVR